MRLSRLTEQVDPTALKVAARTAIFMPVSFGLATTYLGGEATPFAAFGSFIVLAMVTFSGRFTPRSIAWLSLFVAGCVLITVGTLLSTMPIPFGVAAAGLITFLIFYFGVVNPYIAAARNGAVLLLALPLMIEAPESALDDRLAGWVLACVICIPATYLVFRLPWTGELRRRASEVCAGLAALTRKPNSNDLREQTFERVSTLRRRFLSTPHRPTGATGVSAAIASMVEELGWLYGLITIPGAGIDAEGERSTRLRKAVAELLQQCSEALSGADVDLPVDPVERELKGLVDQSATEISIGQGGDVESTAKQLEHEFRLRKVSYATLDLARLVDIATEKERAPGVIGELWNWFSIRSRQQVRETGRIISEHADPSSSWFQNSVRGAVGIALAVLAADLLSVQNAFWVVLGTLMILRNNALGTRGSIGRALAGTLIGILVGSALISLVGDSRLLLWIALPISVLFAAYAPRALSFGAGQAGFAVLVMVLYNLIEPVGWQVAIVRIQDVAVGCAVSLVVGLLIWPRGATDLIRRSLADSLVAGAALVKHRAFGVLKGEQGVADKAWHESLAASDRLDAVLRQYLDETTGEHVDREALLALASSGLRLRRVSKGLGQVPAEPWFEVPGLGTSPALEQTIDEVSDWYRQTGQAIELEQDPPAPLAVDPALPRELIAGIDPGTESSESLGAGIARVWLFENLAYLSALSVRYDKHARDLFAEPEAGLTQAG